MPKNATLQFPDWKAQHGNEWNKVERLLIQQLQSRGWEVFWLGKQYRQ